MHTLSEVFKFVSKGSTLKFRYLNSAQCNSIFPLDTHDIIESCHNGITEYFEKVEASEEYNGYFCRIPDVITIAILGSMCRLKKFIKYTGLK